MTLIHNVERIRAAPIASVLRDQLQTQRHPLIIEGALSDWPALDCWNAESLGRRLGHLRIRYKSSSSNAHPDFRRVEVSEMFAGGSSRFDEFLQFVTTGPAQERCTRLFTGDEQPLLRRREGQTLIHPELAPLLDDFDVPEAVPPDRLYSVWTWFSGQGVRTWLHYDNNGCHNLNAQVSGRKQCTLFPPQEQKRLALFSPTGENPAHNCSAIDVEHPQPQFADDLLAAERWQAEIKAGDLLFIPAWWLHTFFHCGEFNANVNFWWQPEAPLHNDVASRQVALDAMAAAQSTK